MQEDMQKQQSHLAYDAFKNIPPPLFLKQKNKIQTGFTLIEVMIALAIVSIALAALTQSSGSTVLNQAQLESRIMATWVAEDALIQEHVLAGSASSASASKSGRSVTQLNREWLIESRSEATNFPGVKKLLITVTDANDKKTSVSLVTVVGE